MRPCTCDNIRDAAAYTLDQCRLCWLYRHDAAYRALWSGPGGGPSGLEARRRRPCRHRGPAVGEQACPGCRGHVAVKLFACTLHGQCATAQLVAGAICCATCADYAAAETGPEAARS